MGRGVRQNFDNFPFRATNKGFKPDQLDKCMDEYEKLDVWQINQAKTKLTFIN